MRCPGAAACRRGAIDKVSSGCEGSSDPATPSEVAAIAAVLALALVIVTYRTWRFGDMIFRETVRESTMILMIIAAAAVFSYMVSLLYVTQTAAQWLVDMETCAVRCRS